MSESATSHGTLSILILVAGTNDPSNCETLAEAFRRGLDETGTVKTEIIRIKDLSIAHFTLAHYDKQTAEEDDFQRIRNAVSTAHGMVIATPVWNFSIPAHLKNLIDRMGSFALDEETRSKGLLGGKPCYFLFTGGAPLPAWKGLMRFTTSHVQESFRYFGSTIVGTYFEGKSMLGRGKFGLAVDKRPESLAKVQKRGRYFAAFVTNFLQTGKLPLYYRVFNYCYRLGQRIMAKL